MINKDRAIVVHCPKFLHHFFVTDRIDMSSSTKINSISKLFGGIARCPHFCSVRVLNIISLFCVSLNPSSTVLHLFSRFLSFTFSSPHSLSTTCLSSSIESGPVLHISLNRSCDAACLYMLLSKRMRLFLWNVCVCVLCPQGENKLPLHI